MKHPVLDPRDLEAIRAQVARLARSYTPEWRFESAEDDPGASLAELFSTMFHQTVDRMNALPGKLYTEFLNQIGFQEPAPSPASGAMLFTPNGGEDEPVLVPEGTQVFTSDPQGENIVYETERTIEATAAALQDVYYVDPAEDSIQRLDMTRPRRLFTKGEGEEVQRHRLTLGQSDVLRINCPAVISVELRQAVRYLEEETAKGLAAESLTWTYWHEGREFPFDAVRAEGNRILLEKRNHLALEAEEGEEIAIACQGLPGALVRIDLPAQRQRAFQGGRAGQPAPEHRAHRRRPAPAASAVRLWQVRHRQARRGRGNARRRAGLRRGVGVLQRPGLAQPGGQRRQKPLFLQKRRRLGSGVRGPRGPSAHRHQRRDRLVHPRAGFGS